MPPADYGSGVGYALGDYAPTESSPPPARFSRDQLDKTGQKIFDQLKQQRDYLEKSLGADKAKQFYTDITGLNKDESIAMMAAELQSTGITDIYKVKPTRETIQVPVQNDGEGNFITNLDGSFNRMVRDDEIKDGMANLTKTGYVNTETGQPIARTMSGSRFAGDENYLSDIGLARRTFAGTGVQFTPEGVPIYFSQGYKDPSSWKEFTNSIRPLLPIAAMLIPGIGQMFSGVASSILGAGASQAAVGALSQGIASGLAGAIATGDLEKGLISGILSGGIGYGLGAAQGLADVAYAAPQATVDGLTLGDINATAAHTAVPNLMPDSTFLGIDEVDKLFSSQAPSFDAELSMDLVAPEIDNIYGPKALAPEALADSDFLELAMSESDAVSTPAPDKPEWDTSYPKSTNVDPGSLGLSGAGDPTAGFGGMPKQPMTPAQVAAAAAQGISDPYMANEIAGVNPMGAPPSLGERVIAGIGMAAGNLMDKLLTPQGAITAATMLATASERDGGSEGGGGGGPAGWSGSIPRYTVQREKIPEAFERKPYATTEVIGPDGKKTYVPTPTMGRAFFKPLEFKPRQAAAATTTQEQPVPNDNSSVVPAAQGGIMALNKGAYLRGPSDGMADELMTSIDGVQPAALSHGEFVIPADVVSHLGNGNSEAGAKVLHKMMDRVRQARTGTSQQGKQINPDRFVPGGIVQLSNGGSTGTTQTSGGTTGVGAPTSTSSQLSTWAAPVVTENIGRMEALAQEEYQPYTGQLTATASPVQTKVFEAASKLTDPSRQWSATTMNTYMNPYLEGVQKPMMSALEREADKRQQEIQSQFTRAGAFGGARDVIARMENERALAEQKERVLGRTQYDAFASAADMFGRQRDRDVQDLLAMLRVGEAERGIEKETVDTLRAEYEKQQNEPMRRLREFSDTLTKLPIETTTKQTDLSTLEQLGLDLSRGMDLYKILDGMFGSSSNKTT